VQVKEDIFKWITMNITWGASKGRYFQVDNYPRWHDDYPLLIFILESQVAFGTNGLVAESIHILIPICNS
jgi:hypothetical protein